MSRFVFYFRVAPIRYFRGGRDGAAAMRMERCYLWIVAEAFSDRLKFRSIVKGGVTKEWQPL